MASWASSAPKAPRKASSPLRRVWLWISPRATCTWWTRVTRGWRSFEAGGKDAGLFDGSGTPAKAFSAPTAIAVDNSSNPFDTSVGDVYVVDAGNNVVDKFTSGGTYVSQLTATAGGFFSELRGVGVDGNGNVWVSEASGEVAEFTSAGAFVTSWNTNQGGGEALAVSPSDTVYAAVGWGGVFRYSASGNELNVPGTESALIDGGPASGIAFDPASGNVFVDEGSQVSEYEGSGTALPPSFGSGVLTAGKGAAFDDSDGHLYVADATANKVDIFGVVTVADVSTGSATGVGTEAATLNATVNPNGIDATCEFEYGAGLTAPCEPEDVGAGEAEEAVHAHVTGLTPGTSYNFHIVATSVNGTVRGQNKTFTTQAPPSIGEEYATKLSASEATLKAEITSLNEGASYHFEYGESQAYGSSVPVPDGTVAASGGAVTVSQLATGLTVSTTYHFRVVATNGAATVDGPDQTFTTRAVEVAQADTCSNAAVRAEQNASALPDCRAYEMVSPLDKNGGEVVAEGVSTVAAADGEAVSYITKSVFGDAVGSGPAGVTQYVARRSAEGWQNHGATPTPAPNTPASGFAPILWDFSSDLQNAVVHAYALPGVEGAITSPNIYSEDTSTKGLSLITQPLAGPQSLGAMAEDYGAQASSNEVGVSDDGEHVAFDGRTTRLLGQAPSGVPSVYEWEHGALRLVSFLPGESTPTEQGAVLASPNRDITQMYRQTVSPDGSRVLFLSPAVSARGQWSVDGQLYERVDHSRTVWVSEPEVSGSPPTPENVVLQEVTGDSRHVIFDTTTKLLPEDENEGPDLYMYTESPDPAKESNLTLVTNTGDIQPVLSSGAGGGTAVIGSSEDGNWIYYHNGGGGISVWHDGETKIAAREVTVYALSATASTPGFARVSANGRYLAFVQATTFLAGGSKPLIGASGGHEELYLYDSIAEQLRCVSCPGAGPATADAHISSFAANVTLAPVYPGVRPSFLASNGNVYFGTTQALVSGDVNGVEDVYEYNAASESVSLLSSGTSSEPAGFVDASESGHDVFMVTRDRLVRSDQDGYVDMYDVRAGGGFLEPPAPPGGPCAEEQCQGAVSGAPAEAAPASVTFTGGVLTAVPGAVKKVPVSNAQKLRAALKACRQHKTKSQRKRCESQARKRYAKKANKGASGRSK